MTWEKLKEKIEERITTAVFVLVTFLCVAIWQAVPFEAWAQIGKVIPKRALAALIGLLLIGFVTTIAYAYSLHQKLKQTEKQLSEIKAVPPPPKKIPKFGLLWDENLEPYCPAHTDVHLGNWVNLSNRLAGYMCPINVHLVTPKDDNGHSLTPIEAKQRLHSAASGIQTEIETSKQLDQPSDTALNEKLMKTISLLTSFRDNLPKRELSESDRIEYHALLNTAQSELKCDLSEFEISSGAFKQRIVGPVSFDQWGTPLNSPPIESYIPPDIFRRKLDALLLYLEKQI